MRILATKWTTKDIEREEMPFTFPIDGGEALRSQTCVYISDLVSRIHTHLDELYRYINAICNSYSTGKCARVPRARSAQG